MSKKPPANTILCQKGSPKRRWNWQKSEIVFEVIFKLKWTFKCFQGKTEGFQQQVETKQLQLAPWTEKISEKQVQKEVAESELGLLEQKTNANTTAFEAAQNHLIELESQRNEKSLELVVLKKKKKESENKLKQSSLHIEVSLLLSDPFLFFRI